MLTRMLYGRAHSDPTCAATGCAWHCASDSGTSFAGTRWPRWLWSVTRLVLLD
jgi:hypothetical protein